MPGVARPFLLPCVPLLALAGVVACTPVGLVVGVAATGAVMAAQERGFEGGARDTAIRAEINHYWLQSDHETYLRLTLQVWEGRVLVGGALPDAAQRAEALQLAWKVEGVREVINEVQIVAPRDVGRYTRDLVTEWDIYQRLTFTREIDSINYSVEVVNGTVYLLGVARDQAELDRAVAVIREVAHVRRIANHVLLRDDKRRAPTAPA